MYSAESGFGVNVECEGKSVNSYKTVTKLAREIANRSNYCKLNHCKQLSEPIWKQLGPIRQTVNENAPEDTNTRR